MFGNLKSGTVRTFKERCAYAGARLKAEGFSSGERWLLAAYPNVVSNPYPEMLYSRSLENGFGCVRMKKIDQAVRLPRRVRAMVHIHWLNRIYGNVFDIERMNGKEAAQAVQVFLDALKRQKDAGRQIVWTVHNIMSHAAAFPDEELQLRLGMAELSDHIHIMNSETRRLCAPLYDLPSHKVFEVPHPSYKGIYADTVSRDKARQTLGLEPDDNVFLIFGLLGKYKGIKQFINQMDTLQTRVGDPVKLVIAGRAADHDTMQALLDLADSRDDMILHTDPIDDRQMQLYFRAADVALCPQPVGLNSGVAHAAASFGCPVVLAENLAPIMRGLEDFTFSFDPDNMETSVSACVGALKAGKAVECGAAMDAWAISRAPHAISTLFFETLRSRL